MELFTFEAFSPRDARLEQVTIAPLTAPAPAAQVAIFRLGRGGRIARHPTTVPQVLAVVEGSGQVSGADGEPRPITAGEAVFWAAGEEHETVTDEGLVAIVIQAETLRPPPARRPR